MARVRDRVAGCSAILLVVMGCANIHVKKVPIEKRMQGTDDQVRGFRYYLSRPYLVVSKPVTVLEQTWQAKLVMVRPKGNAKANAEYALQGLEPEPGETKVGLYSRSGERLQDEAWVVVDPNPTLAPAPTPNPDPAPAPAKPAEKAVPPLTDAIQVANLPDFEEQYAIRNTNVLAKSTYELHFTDGWTLESASGSWNATDVPVRILQTIQKAIGAATEYEQKRMESAGSDSTPRLAGEATTHRFEMKRTHAIEPGIYRVQKSWEQLPPGPPDGISSDAAFGILRDLGLPVTVSQSVKRL